MSLDDLLNAPLAPVRDDGFSVRILLRLEQARQRQLTLLWCIVAAAVLPVLWFLPVEQLASVRLDVAVTSPIPASAAAILVLLWAWQSRVLRF